jgi:hypothetical protein
MEHVTLETIPNREAKISEPSKDVKWNIRLDSDVVDGKEMKMTRHAHRMYGKMPDCLARCR